jgi:hypothetical protein
MRRLKIVEVRPAKHVVDDRFGGLNPFSRPAQDGQRKGPSGRIAVNAGARGGHGLTVKHSVCQNLAVKALHAVAR